MNFKITSLNYFIKIIEYFYFKIYKIELFIYNFKQKYYDKNIFLLNFYNKFL